MRTTVAKFDVLLSKDAPAPSSAYSQGLAFANLVVTSGYLGTKPDGSGLTPGGFEAELRRALDNVTMVLKEAGCSWSDVIRINVSLTNLNKFSEMDRIFRDYAREPYPTRNTIGVTELWGGAQVGVDVWAVRPAS
jgi:2-iminobutanoate/2-iminopropanoate deaminase